MDDRWERLRSAHLEVNIRYAGSHVPVMDLRGSLDVATRDKLKRAMVELLERKAPKVLVNMTEVIFIDSSGLEVLVSGSRRMKEVGGQLGIVVGSPNLQRIFDVTRLDQFVAIYRSEAEALASPGD